jgi:hypothetical protein
MKVDKEWVLQRLYEEPSYVDSFADENLPDCSDIRMQTVVFMKESVQRFRDEYKTLLLVLAYLLNENVENINVNKLWKAVQEKKI